VLLIFFVHCVVSENL